MSLQNDLSIIQKQVDNLIAQLKIDVDKLIDEEVVIPDWEKIQERKVLFESYRDVVKDNDKIVRKLTHIGKVIISLRDLKSSMGNNSTQIPISLIKKVRRNIDSNLSKLYTYQNLLQEHKGSYDYAVKFFNSAQYTLTSPRLGGQE